MCRFPSWCGRGLALLLLLLTSAGAAGSQQVRPRNVVFILTDDHRYDAMGFHPGAPEWLESPNLDRMARGGVHIANAFVTTALCSPSRASILTGQYTHRHGVVDNARDVPPGTRYFPQYLQQAGYRTAYVGKWHMGQDTDEPRPGFDHWVSFRGQGPYHNPVLNVDGRRVERAGYTTDILTEYALEWLERQRSGEPGRPFFLYLSHKAVHAEFAPAERHAGRYRNAKLTYPETMRRDAPGIDSWPEWVRQQRSSWHGVDYMYHGRISFDDFLRQYGETLLAADESVGKVLDLLERTGLDDNTLVIYMGDNGFSFGEHGLIDKRHAFEESIRVPMLAWGPGLVRPGTTLNQMVMNMDVMPTVLELAGARAPADHAVDGRSFLPLLRGESIPWRSEVFYEYYWEWNFPQTPTQFALRTDRYKYIHFYGLWGQDALFDLQADPGEARNLIAMPQHKQLALDLRGRLFRVMEETGGLQIPLREPRGQPNAARRPAGARSTDPLAEQ
ncbi:MAG: sulfatase [Gemmatimonadetes bacterium]|nr:sulfatase [Gemmatimonadota bacterium]